MTAGIPQFLQPAIASVVETKNVLFDYGALIDNNFESGVHIASITDITVTNAPDSEIIDPNPQNILQGAGEIVPSLYDPAIGNGAVVAWFGACVGGCTYLLQCVVELSDGKSSPSIETRLPCYDPNA